MQQLVDHFYEEGVGVQSKAGFTVSSTEEMVMHRLRKMKDLGTSVFVVHSSEVTATRLFPCAERLGMTVQQIRFNSNEDSVGHLSGSLIAKMALTSPRFRPTNTKGLNTSIEYAQAMLNNTVSFIVDELPYLKVLLVEHPGKFLMVKAQCNTNGFGFMFQKGHELVPLVSREILNLIRTSDKLIDMEKRWFENQLPYTADDTLNPITLFRFRGLFMITGVSFAFALLVLLILWLRDTWEDLMSSVNIFLSQRLVHFRILFARTIHPNPLPDAAIGDNAVQMAQRNNR